MCTHRAAAPHSPVPGSHSSRSSSSLGHSADATNRSSELCGDGKEKISPPCFFSFFKKNLSLKKHCCELLEWVIVRDVGLLVHAHTFSWTTIWSFRLNLNMLVSLIGKH